MIRQKVIGRLDGCYKTWFQGIWLLSKAAIAFGFLKADRSLSTPTKPFLGFDQVIGSVRPSLQPFCLI